MVARLSAGTQAPGFSTVDLDGRPVRLPAAPGRWVLLSFYRYASCPLCNLRVHDLARRAPGWGARGLDLVAVFQSPPEVMRRYVGGQAPPFPLVPDPDQRLYAQYGVGHSWAGFVRAWLTRLHEIADAVFRKGYLPGSVEGGLHRIPADFLIDPAGRIAEAYYGRDIGDHLPVARIEAHLAPAGVPQPA